MEKKKLKEEKNREICTSFEAANVKSLYSLHLISFHRFETRKSQIKSTHNRQCCNIDNRSPRAAKLTNIFISAFH